MFPLPADGAGFCSSAETSDVLASYDASGNLKAGYVTPGLDANLSMTRAGSTYYYMQDGLGSVRNVVDGSQVTQNTYDYYAFGSELAATQGVTSPYQFTGREREAGGILSQHYYRNRYYPSGSKGQRWTGPRS